MDPQALTKGAITDLVDRLDVTSAEVTVVSSEAVTWRDSSLGCPQEGMAYTQVLVDGWLIVLEVDGTTYEYHAGSTATGEPAAPFYCATPQPPLPTGGAT